MAIGKDKVATGIVLPKELKPKLEEIAREQDRSLNNLMVIALKEYVAKYEETKKAPAE